LWPGGLSLAVKNFPLGGTFMFAMLGVSGDIGAALGPWSVGFLSDRLVNIPWLAALGQRLGMDTAALGLRGGLMAALVFPLGSILALIVMKGLGKGRGPS